MRHGKIRLALITIAGSVAVVACSGGGGGGGGGGGNTAVSGTITGSNGLGASTPLAGATVSAAGGPSTTTDASGNYTLMLQSNQQAFIKATAASHVGAELGLVVPAGGVTGKDMTLVSNSDEAQLTGILNLTIDPAKGGLLVNFNAVSNPTGLGATLSAVHGSSFTLSNANFPQISDHVLGNQNPFLIFTNVDTGTTTITPTGGTCTSAEAITNWPIEAGTITGVDFNCQ